MCSATESPSAAAASTRRASVATRDRGHSGPKVRIEDVGSLKRVQEDVRRWRLERRHETDVIRMLVRDEKVRPAEVNGERVQGRPHGIEAFGPVHPGVDHEKTILAADHIGVDGPQGIPGERDFDAMDVRIDFLQHSPILSRVASFVSSHV